MIDIMIDLETLGIRDDALVTQISAKAFRLGKQTSDMANVNPFNRFLDFKSLDVLENVEVGTLNFWLKDAHNVETFKSMLSRNSDTPDTCNDYDLWHNFHSWLAQFASSEDIRVWGNGISFDIVKIKTNFQRFGLDIPFMFWNERDVRTIVDLGAEKLGITSRDFQKSVPNNDKHNALADVNWQIDYVQKAHSVLGLSHP